MSNTSTKQKFDKQLMKYLILVIMMCHQINRDYQMYLHVMLFCCYTVQEYFEYLEKGRGHELDVLARKYRAIGPLLTKMEGLVAHTNTGRSPKLQPYYEYWENAVYESLTKVGDMA